MENIKIILLGISFLFSDAQNVAAQQNGICLTRDCVKVAARVIGNMAENVDPCEDFYEFACGGFEKETFIKPYEVHVNEITKLQDKVLEKLLSLFEDSPSPGEPAIFESVRNLYKSCMDVEEIEKNSLNHLKSLLEQVGGFPVIEGNNWNESDYNPIDVALKLQSLGLKGSLFVDLILHLYYYQEIQIKKVDVGISRENALKGEDNGINEAHLQYLIGMAKLLGASDQAAEKEMRDVLDFKIRIARVESLSEMGSTALKDIPSLYPNILWVDLIKNYLDTGNFSSSPFDMGDMVDEDDNIWVYVSASYLNEIRGILANTSKRVLANYQISESIPMAELTGEALEILATYKKDVEGRPKGEPRWKMCLHSVGDFGNITNFHKVGLRIATSAMYVRKYFNNETEPIINNMINNLIEEFDIILKEINWIDEDTRNKTSKMLHDMKLYVGYANGLLNNSIVDQFYQGLQFSPKGFLKNKIEMSKYFFKKYNEIEAMDYWTILAESDEVTAYYFHSIDDDYDMIFISAALIGGAIFDPNWPLYMKYGALGYAISHEITHATDVFLQSSWRHGNTYIRDLYMNKTQCIIDEYQNYTFLVDGEKVHINGEKTKMENLADIIGNKIVYRTYQKQSSSLEEGVLPGLPYSQNQLFWLGVADVWCSKNRPQFILHQIAKDSHTPEKFRTNGPLSNLEEFSKDWKCPVGSKMNPVQKCHVW